MGGREGRVEDFHKTLLKFTELMVDQIYTSQILRYCKFNFHEVVPSSLFFSNCNFYMLN